MPELTELLNAKSSGKEAFEIGICRDEFLSFTQFANWTMELYEWANKNEYFAEFLEPTSPITIDGETHLNPLMKSALVKFTKIKPQ